MGSVGEVPSRKKEDTDASDARKTDPSMRRHRRRSRGENDREQHHPRLDWLVRAGTKGVFKRHLSASNEQGRGHATNGGNRGTRETAREQTMKNDDYSEFVPHDRTM